MSAVQVNNICLGCMAEYVSGRPCTICGWPDKAAPSSAIFLPPGSVLNGQYLLGRVLGAGGFGVTYLGRDLNLGMKVAIKEFFPRELVTREPGSTAVVAYTGDRREFFEHGLDRFLDEAQVLARFSDHPGVASVVNFFKAHGTGYLVMKYAPGRTFKDYLDSQGGKIPFETARSILLPVMDTLREVHSQGLLHRDISPDNIYITTTGQIKLFDFGAARCAIGERSQNMSVILKPGYAPMEQYVTNGNQGPWTDVYGLGATLYRAITSFVPPEALGRVEHDLMTPPGKLVPAPPGVDAVVMRSLAVRPKDRFQNVLVFQQALAAVAIPRLPEPRPRFCAKCNAANQPGAKSCEKCGASFIADSPAVSSQYAGLERRLGAWVIDSILLSVVGLIALLALFALTAVAGMRQDDALSVATILSVLFMSVVGLLYFGIMDSSSGQGTIGKRVLGIAVTDLNGSRISFLRAVGRYIAKGAGLMFCGIGPIAAAFTEKKQGLHDIIAGTLVVNKK